MNQSEEIKSAEAVLSGYIPKERWNNCFSEAIVIKVAHEYHNQFKSEWVSVKDRLPDSGVWVRVIFDNSKAHILPHCYDGKSWWCYGSSISNETNVTHWQYFTDLTPHKV